MTLQDEIMADAPVGYWRAVDGIDHSGHGLTLTRFSSGSLATSPVNAASLDTSNPDDPGMLFLGNGVGGDNLWNPEHYVELNNLDDAGMSMSFLIQPAAGSLDGVALHDTVRKGAQYGIYIGSDSKLHAFIQIGGFSKVADGTTVLTAGTTYHVGMSHDQATLKLFVNGVMEGSVGAVGTADHLTDSFTIGTTAAAANGYDGIADEVAVYSHMLDPARFAAHHAAANSAPPPPTTTTVAHHSGGTGNVVGASSLGGGEGGVLASSSGALFGSPGNADRVAGVTDYRCIYLHNPSTTDTISDVRLWIDTPSVASDVDEAVGEDTQNPAQTIANAKAAPAGVVFSAPADYATGLTLGALGPGATIPVWVRRTVSAGAIAGSRSFTLGSSWTGNTTPVTLAVAYEIVAPVTLYVNADHASADDTRTRATAADDPALPFKTVRAAVWAVQPGDTVQVEPALNADATNADPSIYAAFDARTTQPPAANSSASSDPTRIVGHVVGGKRPKVAYWNSGGLNNWQIENIQFGYDRGSGLDHDTAGFFSGNYRMVFRNCVWTGGVFWVRGFGDLLWLDGCEVYHPFTGSNFFSGVGMWLIESEGGVAPIIPGEFRVTSCTFADCHGEDAIQCSSFGLGSKIEIGVNSETGEVLGNRFLDMPQTGSAHTDAIQCFGIGGDITIVGNYFRDCASPIILSDGHFIGRVIIAKNVFGEGSVWAIQIQGCDNAWILHNTCRTIWQIAVQTRQLGVSQNVRIVNNVLPRFIFGSDIDAASVVSNNIVYETPGLGTPWGTQLPGLPEFGTSTRLTDAGLTGGYELATSPVAAPGIGEGRSLAGLGLTSTELGYLAADHLGRAYATARDVGALQSSAAVVTAEPRPPYVLNTFPTSVGAPDTDVTVDLVPVPGQVINAATVDATTCTVADAATGVVLPAVVSVAAPDVNGHQRLTIAIKASVSPVTEGTLWPRVLYTVNLAGVQDSQGSQIAATSWQFRADGPPGPAVSSTAALVGGWAVGAI